VHSAVQTPVHFSHPQAVGAAEAIMSTGRKRVTLENGKRYSGNDAGTELIRDGEVDCGASRMTEDDKNDEQLGIYNLLKRNINAG
jgi:hypothetical protein